MRSEVRSEIAGLIWKVVASVGQTVAADEPLVIIESMKMEIPVLAAKGGLVQEVRVNEGDEIAEGQILLVLTT
jgi:acetyl-CoA carboxylase biotin carboxyl carrier protein